MFDWLTRQGRDVFQCFLVGALAPEGREAEARREREGSGPLLRSSEQVNPAWSEDWGHSRVEGGWLQGFREVGAKLPTGPSGQAGPW